MANWRWSEALTWQPRSPIDQTSKATGNTNLAPSGENNLMERKDPLGPIGTNCDPLGPIGTNRDPLGMEIFGLPRIEIMLKIFGLPDWNNNGNLWFIGLEKVVWKCCR